MSLLIRTASVPLAHFHEADYCGPPARGMTMSATARAKQPVVSAFKLLSPLGERLGEGVHREGIRQADEAKTHLTLPATRVPSLSPRFAGGEGVCADDDKE